MSIAAALYLVTFLTYAFFFGGTGWNQNATFALARALVERGSIDITPYAADTKDTATVGTQTYSNKAPGTSFLAAIPYGLLFHLERLTGISPDEPITRSRNLYACTAVVSAGLGAMVAPFIYLAGVVRLGVSRRWSLLVALLTALGTPLFPYASLLFLHDANAAFLMLALYFALGSRARDPALSGVAAGLAALTNYLALPIVPAFALLTAAQSHPGRWRRLGAFLVAAALPLALLFWYQNAAFGQFLENPVARNPAFTDPQAFLGVIRLPSSRAFWGITVSPYRGLFFLSPFLFFSVLGAVRLARSRSRLPLLGLTAVTIALFVAFNVTFNGWSGGNGIGPRYLVPAIPFMALLLLPLDLRPGPLRAAILAFGGVSVAHNFAAAAVNPQPFEGIANPLRDQIYPILVWADAPQKSVWLADGHVSVHPDSMNLGEFLFGSGNPMSLLPVTIWIVAGGAALFTIVGFLHSRSARPADPPLPK